MLSKRALVASLVTSACIALAAGAQAQTEYSLEPAPPLASVRAPDGLVSLLDPQGSRLVHNVQGKKDPIADVWWVKSAPAIKPTDTAPDILVNNLAVGTLVGLLQFDSPDAEDARDQKIKPGLYTMRYGQIPQDGNHMGVSQYRDFLLLSPVAADTQYDKVLSFNDLVNVSRKTTGTGHPAVFFVNPANPAYKKLPAVVADDQGNCSIQVDLHETGPSGPEDVQFELLLVTPPKESGGS